jgi:hypothetical protein
MIHSSILRCARHCRVCGDQCLAQVGLPATPPDAPGLFRCAAPDAIGRVFRDTGMHDVAETDVHGFSEPASAKDYCT